MKNNGGGHLRPFVMLGRTPPGTCPECAVDHPPEYPHNRDSLTYQYKFFDKHGRWPTWNDAMSHCSEEMKNVWIEELQKRGVDVACQDKGAEMDLVISLRDE